MAKIVYNACYGGFALSDAAVMRYAELKGLTLYKKKKYGIMHYITIPWEQYDKLANTNNSCNLNDLYFWVDDLERNDPILVQVVEELGEDANGANANLRIHELPTGTIYRIDEYDGFEYVKTVDTYDWKVA